MLKQLSIASLALSALMVVGCDGSNIVECESDADCSGDTPVCEIPDGDTVGQCVAEGDDPECEEDLDCQLANADSATSASDCGANADCGGGDRCVEDQLGAAYCVGVAADQADCDLIDLTYVALTDVEGGATGGCVADGACTEDGACE